MIRSQPLPDMVLALEQHRAGRLAEAEQAYEAMLRIAPDNADALNLLGSLRKSQGRLTEAIALATQAAQSAPDRADIRYNLGNACLAAGDAAGAQAAFRAALDRDPRHVEAATNLAICLSGVGELDEAAAFYEAALAIDPLHKTANLNLANLLVDLGRHESAIGLLRNAVARWPDLAEAHYNLGLCLMRLGDFGNGLPAFEWRWRATGFASPARHTRLPAWDGRPFRGQTLLLHAEQGFGDTLQFVRFATMAATLGGSITLEVPAVLLRLLKDIQGVDRFVGVEGAAGRHDWQAPLMSLPHRLGLTMGSIPASTAYLVAETDRVAAWRSRLRPDGRPIIALNWQGNKASPVDAGRSLDGPAALEPLASIPNVRFVSVCRLPPEDLRRSSTPTGWAVAAAPFELEYPGLEYDTGPDAFLDAAAILALSHQVVTTDTAIAHLAGAMGRPGLLLLKAVADWRWFVNRRDTPWYPSLRLVRQPKAGQFRPAIEEAARLLASRLSFRSVGHPDGL